MSDNKVEDRHSFSHGLAHEAMMKYGKSRLNISATLDIEKPETIHNFNTLAGMLADAYDKGVASAQPKEGIKFFGMPVIENKHLGKDTVALTDCHGNIAQVWQNGQWARLDDVKRAMQADHIRDQLQAVIDRVIAEGIIPTVAQVPKQKLALGSYDTLVSVRLPRALWPQDPVPSGVHFDVHLSEFQGAMGQRLDPAFTAKWYGRRHEFPTCPHLAAHSIGPISAILQSIAKPVS